MNSRFTRRDIMRTTTGVGGAAAVVLAGGGIADAATSSSSVAWLNVTDPAYGAKGDGVSADGAAIQAALNAVPATGVVVYLPAGQYVINAASLSIVTANTWLLGDGWGTQILFDGSVVPTCVVGASADRSCAISDLSILQTNANTVGTAIDGSNFNNARITNVFISGKTGASNAPLIGIDFDSTSAFYNIVRDSEIAINGSGGIGIRLNGGAHSNVIDNVRFIHGGQTDANCAGVYVSGSHSTTIIRADVEGTAGNGIWLDAGSSATTLLNCYLEGNNINLLLAAGVQSLTVVGGTAQNGTVANIQNNGAINPIILNAWPNSSTETYNHLELGNTDTLTVNGVSIPTATWEPTDVGLTSWNYDPALHIGTTATANGTLYLMRVIFRYATTVNSLAVGIDTAGANATQNHNFLGLYNSSGTLVASTAAGAMDSLIATTGMVHGSVTATTVPAGAYWVAVLFNATTPPALVRAGTNQGIADVGISSGANRRFAVNGTGLTTLPSTINTGANTTSGAVTFFVGTN